jgi:pyruvate formate lyase activating enzyme
MSAVSTHYWHTVTSEKHKDKIQCDLCPRYCKLSEGQRGLCYVRGREDNQIKLFSYGRSSGFCIDPIEKKPLHHFYPGSSVLSFGTAGCNLACKFCQNWDMSKSREMDTLAAEASPEVIAKTAIKYGCRSVAFTYNDPVIFLEYARDTAIACHELDVKSVAVTAGYICEEAREEFFRYMDAANVDLKAFDPNFYKKICGGKIEPVLDTLKYLVHETNVWVEITTLLIPDYNDSDKEIDSMTLWIAEHLGRHTPLHFTAFHPDYKMNNLNHTPASTLSRARTIALNNGLEFVYTGNIHDTEGSSTYCPSCNQRLIERDWYRLGKWNLKNGRCRYCQQKIAGYFETSPGNFGPKRIPLTHIFYN